MKTEEQARQCWCPWARIPWFDGPQRPEPKFVVMASVNRTPVGFGADQPQPVIARCIASECMAWRWLEEKPWAIEFNAFVFSDKSGDLIQAIKIYRAATGATLKEAKDYAEGVKGGQIPKPLEITDPTWGFCGLAGSP